MSIVLNIPDPTQPWNSSELANPSPYRDWSRSMVYASVLIALTLMSWIGFGSVLGLFEAPQNRLSFGAAASTFDWFAAELGIIVLVGIWLVNGGMIARVASYVLGCVFLLTLWIQLVTLFQGQSYLTRLAVENIESIALVMTPLVTVSAVVAFFVATVPWLVIERYCTPLCRTSALRKTSVALTLAIAISATSSSWLPSANQQQRENYLAERALLHTAPTLALIQLIDFGQQTPTQTGSPNAFTQVLEGASKLGIKFRPDREYPLIKESLYETPLTFAPRNNVTNKRDVLIVFIEGLSARSIGTYGGKFEGLTPNLDEFARSAMRVDGYYSHTAATYRGLLGQLCSAYPADGGSVWGSNAQVIKARHYFCLNNLLAENGYVTEFLDVDLRTNQKAFVDEMASAIGFETVLGGDELVAQYLPGERPITNKGAISDTQAMNALIQHLEQRATVPAGASESLAGRAPTLTVLYTMGTHAFQDIWPDGTNFGIGDNTSLNTIHTFDKAFGAFWKYFKNSPHANSTVLIVTTDHAHFPEPEFIKVAGDNYKRWFVDKIPLLIYDPTRELPSNFTANNRSSIDLAPTVAHLLELPPSRFNPFLGTSLFEDRINDAQFAAAAVAPEVFLVDSRGMHINIQAKIRTGVLGDVTVFIEHLYELERRNKIWPTPSKN